MINEYYKNLAKSSISSFVGGFLFLVSIIVRGENGLTLMKADSLPSNSSNKKRLLGLKDHPLSTQVRFKYPILPRVHTTVKCLWVARGGGMSELYHKYSPAFLTEKTRILNHYSISKTDQCYGVI